MIGESPAFLKAMEEADRLAATSLSLAIYGQSGTGKEAVARRIHDRSPRANGPFVTIDCTKLPRDLIESILFGHEKGAFTGAVAARVGLFEQADGGTVFLDEVAELPQDQQVKLLRVLQEGEVLRIGASKPRLIDIRVVAATNRNLAEMVKQDEFREDLYYRLVGDRIALPPLHRRGNDVVLIANAILQQETSKMALTNDAREFLVSYEWPGNIRQLQNILRGSAARTDGRWLDRKVLANQVRRITHFIPAEASPTQTSSTADETKSRSDTDLLDAVLKLIKERGPVRSSVVRAELRVRKTACYEALSKLESAGRIRRIGHGPKTEYVAIDRAGHAASGAGDGIEGEVLKILAATPASSLHDIQAILSTTTTPRALRSILQRLRLRGRVRSDGRGRGARWYVDDWAGPIPE